MTDWLVTRRTAPHAAPLAFDAPCTPSWPGEVLHNVGRLPSNPQKRTHLTLKQQFTLQHQLWLHLVAGTRRSSHFLSYLFASSVSSGLQRRPVSLFLMGHTRDVDCCWCWCVTYCHEPGSKKRQGDNILYRASWRHCVNVRATDLASYKSTKRKNDILKMLF